MFIDIHVHTMSFAKLPWAPGMQCPATPEQLVEMYDEVGIDQAVLLPFVIPECNPITQCNEEMLMIAERFPGRFIPFCNIDPRTYNNSASYDLSYVMNYYKDQGCKGIGEMTANLPFDDPRVTNLFDHAEKCGLPVTFHVASRDHDIYGLIDRFGLPGLEKQLQDHPDLVLFGHSASFWAFISGNVTEDEWEGYPKGPVTEGGRIPELMRKYPNLHGDLSAGSGYGAVSRNPDFGYQFMNEFQDQLLFGTDVCQPKNRENVLVLLKDFMEQGLATGKLSQESFAKISHKNAIRILGL